MNEKKIWFLSFWKFWIAVGYTYYRFLFVESIWIQPTMLKYDEKNMDDMIIIK